MSTRHSFGTMLAIVLASSAGAASVSGSTYTFLQEGFSQGATIAGSFSGTDLDGNGRLSHGAGEIDGFNLTFTGNALVGPFTLGMGDLIALVWDIGSSHLGDGVGDGSLFDGEVLLAGGFPYLYATGLPFYPGTGALTDLITDQVDYALQLPVVHRVSSVPDSGVSLTAFGLTAMGWVAWGRRRPAR